MYNQRHDYWKHYNFNMIITVFKYLSQNKINQSKLELIEKWLEQQYKKSVRPKTIASVFLDNKVDEAISSK